MIQFGKVNLNTGPGTSYQSPFLENVSKTFLDKSWSGFWVISKITLANLCSTIHIIIIPVSSNSLNLEIWKGKEQIRKKWTSLKKHFS